MLFAFKCNTRFAVLTIPPEDDELLEELELLPLLELEEEPPLDELLEPEEEDPPLLEDDDPLEEEPPLDELLEEEPIQTGTLH